MQYNVLKFYSPSYIILKCMGLDILRVLIFCNDWSTWMIFKIFSMFPCICTPKKTCRVGIIMHTSPDNLYKILSISKVISSNNRAFYRCADCLWGVWKFLQKEYSSPFGVSICTVIKVLKKFYSNAMLFNVCPIYPCNILNSGIYDFPQFF